MIKDKIIKIHLLAQLGYHPISCPRTSNCGTSCMDQYLGFTEQRRNREKRISILYHRKQK